MLVAHPDTGVAGLADVALGTHPSLVDEQRPGLGLDGLGQLGDPAEIGAGEAVGEHEIPESLCGAVGPAALPERA